MVATLANCHRRSFISSLAGQIVFRASRWLANLICPATISGCVISVAISRSGISYSLRVLEPESENLICIFGVFSSLLIPTFLARI